MSVTYITCWYGETHHLLPDYSAATALGTVVTVDNATPYATHIALRGKHERIRGVYLRNERNAGFAAGNNQGYAAASGDVLVFINSDIAGPPDLTSIIASDVRDGYLYGPSLQRQLVYGRWVPYVEGWCIAATRSTWDRLRADRQDGPWDATAYPGPYWEDNDLCLRALRANIGLVWTTWPVQHKGGASAGAIARWAESLEANRAVFVERCRALWGDV